MSDRSPFHDGERAVQSRVGVRDQIETVGRRFIRNYMPEQHREFFAQLVTMFIGSVDDRGRPWASVLWGKPGFMQSPTRRALIIDAAPLRTLFSAIASPDG